MGIARKGYHRAAGTAAREDSRQSDRRVESTGRGLGGGFGPKNHSGFGNRGAIVHYPDAGRRADALGPAYRAFARTAAGTIGARTSGGRGPAAASGTLAPIGGLRSARGGIGS